VCVDGRSRLEDKYVLWSSQQAADVLVAGAEALVQAELDGHLPMEWIVTALRKERRLLRWMGNKAVPGAAAKLWVFLLKRLLSFDSTSPNHEQATLLLAEVRMGQDCGALCDTEAGKWRAVCLSVGSSLAAGCNLTAGRARGLPPMAVGYLAS
jgi:hypothetical protein